MVKFNLLNGLIKVTLYTGPITKVYADNFKLSNGRIKYDKVTENHKQEATFYLDKDAGADYVSVELGGVLPDKKGAEDLCSQVVSANYDDLMRALNGTITDIKERQRIFKSVTKASVLYYYDFHELKKEREVSKKELKNMLDDAENARNNQKNKK